MDRGQVEDVEPHAGDVLEPVDHVPERPMPSWLRRRGAGEELVPRGERGTLAVDPELEDGGAHTVRARVVAREELACPLARRALGPLGGREGRVMERRGERAQFRGLAAAGATGMAGDEVRADREVDLLECAGGSLEQCASPPGRDVVDPGRDAEGVQAHLVGREPRQPRVVAGAGFRVLAGPAVGLLQCELGVVAGRVGEGDDRREQIVPVREDVSDDVDRATHGPFRRIATFEHVRAHALDDDALPGADLHVHSFLRCLLSVPKGA